MLQSKKDAILEMPKKKKRNKWEYEYRNCWARIGHGLDLNEI